MGVEQSEVRLLTCIIGLAVSTFLEYMAIPTNCLLNLG